MASSQILSFQPLSSHISPTFWHALTKLKIDVLKLSSDNVPIQGNYDWGKWVWDKNADAGKGKEVGLGGGCALEIDQDAFVVAGQERQQSSTSASVAPIVTLRGTLKNFNTIEEFKNADKQAIFDQLADELWKTTTSGSSEPSPSDLNPFLALTFADLKKYKYYYWFAFPAFAVKPAWEIVGETPALEPLNRRFTEEQSAAFLHSCASYAQSGDQPRTSKAKVDTSAFIARKSEGKWEMASIGEWDTFFAGVPEEERTLVFLDPSTHTSAVGWPLRNILTYINQRYKVRKLQIVAWRDDFSPAIGNNSMNIDPSEKRDLRSKIATVALPGDAVVTDPQRPGVVGWEKNAAGKLGARLADLGPMMDPRQLADQAVDLNLKLMRWRILPALDLEKIKETRCLLLGAGTLGCYVARSLMAWGVRKITLVDSSKVSFSNPVRQPLFVFEDCLEGGKPKAQCAADSLKRIYPNVDATGIQMSIPMPGHPVPPSGLAQTKADVDKLEQLFDEHDVVYLLMDSRESRWLPTLLGTTKRKMVMNAALGFDSYLVMRHGVPDLAVETPETPATSSTTPSPLHGRLGCYFCNDIVAPSDSLTDRTLDQMCTVTRPGLAAIASATAVELMVSVLQHPKGAFAASDTVVNTNAGPILRPESDGESVLGAVPHQIRGFLAQFNNMKITGQAYNQCTGCSDRIVSAYQKDGFEMLLKVFNDAKYLETLTGLDKLHEESEAALESVDWDEEDDEL